MVENRAINKDFMKYLLRDLWEWCKSVALAALVGLIAATIIGLVYQVSPLIAFIVFVVFIAWLFER